jgi:predicted NAD/FAD-dependent oxidoreductase
MRNLTLVLTIGLLVLGVTVLARGEDEGSQLADLQKQVERLELQVSYLRAREADLTTYALGNQARAEMVQAMIAKMDEQGYTARAIPANCRVTHMDGMKALAKSLLEQLPIVSEEQTALLKAISRAE